MPSQEFAQGTLDDPAYSLRPGEEDILDLDPDGDGIACNNPGNLVGGVPVGHQSGTVPFEGGSAPTTGVVQYENAG